MGSGSIDKQYDKPVVVSDYDAKVNLFDPFHDIISQFCVLYQDIFRYSCARNELVALLMFVWFRVGSFSSALWNATP